MSMSENLDISGKPGDASTSRRLKLVMPSIPDRNTQMVQPGDTPDPKESSRSPTRPSYSPVTPTLPESETILSTSRGNNLPQEKWMETPPALPVSLDDNSDAIALRSAISILQMQRQQSLRDIRQLDKLKQSALDDPQSFVNELGAGRLDPAFRDTMDVSINDEDDVEDGGVSDRDQEKMRSMDSPKFRKLPSAQNVVRAPPIEWAKYHVAGDALEKLHQVQQHYPGWTENTHTGANQPQSHNIAAPYRPFTDRLDTSQISTRPKQNNT